MVSTATVSSKGQITLPKRLRTRLGIQTGDLVTIEARDGRIVIQKAPHIFELIGIGGRSVGAARERKRMEEAVARHVMGKDE